MKRLIFILFVALTTLNACKKDTVDATTTKTFQSSINDMASSLTTLQQVKFNEALYILKTFGVEGGSDIEKINALGKKINGMKVPQILSLADQVASKNGIEWSSTGPPSLGEMNIFGNEEASQYDPNDVKASSLSLTVIETMKDSVLGPKAIQVVPRLVDQSGKPIDFSGAALETVLEVHNSNGKLLTSKNLMQDNDFSGFTIRMASLPSQKITDGTIDITVTVKTTAKNFKMSKIGVPVNLKALRMPAPGAGQEQDLALQEPADPSQQNPNADNALASPSSDPKTTVTRFLNHLSSQNLKAAYETSDNAGWGSYDQFSNPTSGFGAVKSINVKNITTKSASDKSAQIGATYDVTDKTGKTTSLQVTFGLKNIKGEWKITNYNINQ
ncbi:hypothetical protein [Bergeyella sp. RCAD1439]|uniref:hypothetical protein n=1 Tax=Bergeyella anatis TaxID=3113737 RepID=UPI002E18474B|nr:hypothetical protein [Bergeyella sp. RCAD1439]